MVTNEAFKMAITFGFQLATQPNKKGLYPVVLHTIVHIKSIKKVYGGFVASISDDVGDYSVFLPNSQSYIPLSVPLEYSDCFIESNELLAEILKVDYEHSNLIVGRRAIVSNEY